MEYIIKTENNETYTISQETALRLIAGTEENSYIPAYSGWDYETDQERTYFIDKTKICSITKKTEKNS